MNVYVVTNFDHDIESVDSVWLLEEHAVRHVEMTILTKPHPERWTRREQFGQKINQWFHMSSLPKGSVGLEIRMHEVQVGGWMHEAEVKDLGSGS